MICNVTFWTLFFVKEVSCQKHIKNDCVNFTDNVDEQLLITTFLFAQK